MLRRLRRGDLVEVLGPAEIFATLDQDGKVDGLPFMPEMVAYCGRRLVVDRRADKICDTIKQTGSRRLTDTVLLGDFRCDGSGHDGCQTECRIFWKEVWLRSVPEGAIAAAPADKHELETLTQSLARHVRRPPEVGQTAKPRWMCQNTELFNASELLSVWDPRTYLNEYTNGNISLGRCLRVSARAVVEEPIRRLGMAGKFYMLGSAVRAPSVEPLNLQPGDWVQVRSKEEILSMLTPEGRTRGLWFDREMAAYCGQVFRVRRRISKFIDEFKEGLMVEMKSDAVTLDGAVCSGDLSQQRWFCPREIYPYWRECWLKRVDTPPAT